ncbi:LOW QUALITY PROTEIN: uncharacterized protein EMH_0035300 [Eimeria mitis]|uniref:GCC2 and GCC3 domain-containing protein n=1 Tax=Eimeria mitis TaxID=44415 RepID=U6JUX7_9EIME|nr:LOW QUALITY PROTEIN: uncharacterized protein EMH_0035300 [Eimeria mitis]CDJ27837.1 hypothetical protein EMH_0035300 [Eimeria mitis]
MAACEECLAGHYCSEEGTSREQMEKQKCPAGAYCDAGVDSVPVPASHPCPAGNYCPEVRDHALSPFLQAILAQQEITARRGQKAPSSVRQGPSIQRLARYQEGARSEEECDKCPQGYYCDENDTLQKCPEGHYCELGTVEPKRCPAGTFSKTTGNASVYDCTDCPPGKYCESEGLPEPTGPCRAGYLCYKRATSDAPTDGVTGELCTPGGYCKAGATTKSYCPRGKYNPNRGGSREEDCVDCPPGYFCTGSDSTEPDGECEAGAYCIGSADNSRQHVAEIGHYAASGSSKQTKCPAGSFGPHEGLGECYLCASGWMTVAAGQSQCDPCSMGMYCPDEGTSSPRLCPAGTYRNAGYGSSVSSCHQCPPHKACTREGESGKTLQDCEEGYYCIFGSSSTTPSKDDPHYDKKKAGPCLPGMYCPGGEIPSPCPRGKLGLAEGQVSESECTACPAGEVCEALGGLDSSPCPEGFFCQQGTTTAERVANLCPTGKFCPLGSVAGDDCSAGTFAPFSGMAECLTCPAGYLADEADIQSCLGGKFSNPGSMADSDCKTCPAGYYCPEASSTPIPCKGGTLCSQEGREEHTESCPQGMYCEAGTIEYIQPSAQQCPAGSYCPGGSSAPIACPMGTFLRTLGAASDSECAQCPEGR